MTNAYRNLHRAECVKCGKVIPFSNTDFFCEPCKGKQNLIKTLGWASVAGVSLFCPPLAGTAAEARKWVEEAFIGNPSEKKISDLHNQIAMLNRELISKEFESLKDKRLQRTIEQEKLIENLYITVGNPWRRIAKEPNYFGVCRLERVNISTRLEYLDYPLFIDIFVPDPEGKGLLHGGIPVEVISPMIAESKIRKPMPYSYEPKDLSQPVDRIY